MFRASLPSYHRRVFAGLIYTILMYPILCHTLFSDEPDSAKVFSRPSDTELSEAKEVIESLFADDFARAQSATAKISLARKLLETGVNTTDDAAGCYWLLSEAHRIAIDVGDLMLAFEAADNLGRKFQDTEASTLRASASEKLSSDEYPITTSKQIADSTVENVELAIATDNFLVARIFIKSGLTAAERLGNSRLRDLLNDLSEDIENLDTQKISYDRSVAKLATQPDDMNANRFVGVYLALRMNNWIESEKHLRRIGEMNLRSIVSREFKSPQTAAERVQLADDWWLFAEQMSGAEQLQAQSRSIYWYKQAVDSLEGLSRRKIEKRISSISEEALARIHAPTTHRKMTNDSNNTAPVPEKNSVPIVNSIGMVLIPIPAGEFMMGSSPNDAFAKRDERPQHAVQISGSFHIGAYEITQEQYARVMQRSKPLERIKNHAVGGVSWEDAQLFCLKLSAFADEKRENRIYRLPTEAEWEYACRAGTTSRYYFGDDPEEVHNYAWTAGSITNVGTKKPNAWGLYDMQGNATEWCSDWYSASYYQTSPGTDPIGPRIGSERVHRGSSWGSSPADSRSSARWHFNSTQRYPTVGFRVVCEIE